MRTSAPAGAEARSSQGPAAAREHAEEVRPSAAAAAAVPASAAEASTAADGRLAAGVPTRLERGAL